MGKFWAAIEVIRSLINAVNYVIDWLKAKKKAEQDEKAVKREEAVKKSEKAETDEDVWNEQDRIIDSKP